MEKIILKRTLPRITMIMEYVVYPGVNFLEFRDAKEKDAFLQDSAFLAGKKSGALILLDNNDDLTGETVIEKAVTRKIEKSQYDNYEEAQKEAQKSATVKPQKRK